MNLGLAIGFGLVHHVRDDLFLLNASESQEGMDLNGDGDALDLVGFFVSAEDLALTPLGFAIGLVSGNTDYMVTTVDEASAQDDLNGDGDMTDDVFHLLHRESLTFANLGLAAAPSSGNWVVTDEALGFLVSESEQQEDLDGDQALLSLVPHYLPLGKMRRPRGKL